MTFANFQNSTNFGVKNLKYSELNDQKNRSKTTKKFGIACVYKKNYTFAPNFLMVLTAGQYAYRREDGVYVVPIGCLKP